LCQSKSDVARDHHAKIEAIEAVTNNQKVVSALLFFREQRANQLIVDELVQQVRDADSVFRSQQFGRFALGVEMFGSVCESFAAAVAGGLQSESARLHQVESALSRAQCRQQKVEAKYWEMMFRAVFAPVNLKPRLSGGFGIAYRPKELGRMYLLIWSEYTDHLRIRRGRLSSLRANLFKKTCKRKFIFWVNQWKHSLLISVRWKDMHQRMMMKTCTLKMRRAEAVRMYQFEFFCSLRARWEAKSANAAFNLVFRAWKNASRPKSTG
jgi:hypothetical protein